MTKTWQLRALCVYLTLGLPLAASCAKETNTLSGDDTSTGATTSSGGNTSSAGTTVSTGKAGTGTTSAFGGTSTSGGSGAGGKTGTAGSVAAGGGGAGGKASGGTGGGGGSGGATMVPADVLARASAIVYYQTVEVAEMDKTIQMQLFIKNQSPDPLPMSHVKIRYWFTAEVTPVLHQYYTGPQAQTPKAAFVDAAANSHALMTFGGGSIVMGGDINATQVQLTIDNTMNSPFNQKDDFSWNAADKTSTPNDKITLYLDDKLIWGCEPSGACFDDAAGGAGAGGAANGAGGAP